MTDKKDIFKILAILGSVYVRDVNAMTKEQKAQMSTTWAAMLQDIPVDILEQAVHAHIKTSKWFPTISELREAAVACVDKFGGETASGAFGTILREIQRGTRRDETVSQIALESLRAVGGWGDVGRSTKVEFLRNEFIKVYNQLREQNSRESCITNFGIIAERLKGQKCLT